MRVQSRYNYYKVFPDEYSHTEEFDEAGNLIIEYDDKTKERLKFPQLKDSPISKYPKGKIYVSENEKKVIEMVKKDRRHADKLD